MNEAAYTQLVTAVGLPGFLLFVFYKLAVKYGFFERDAGTDREVMNKLDKLSDKIDAGRKENETEFRGIRDRLTTVETISKEQARRLDRLER